MWDAYTTPEIVGLVAGGATLAVLFFVAIIMLHNRDWRKT